MLPKSFQIETSRLLLRIPDTSDIPFIFSAANHPGFTDGLMWEPPEKIAELEESLKKTIKAWENGEGYSFTITKKGFRDLVGRISIRKTDQQHLWNVGFWTHPTSQNQGIISEALQAIMGFGFEELGADKIEACYALWNKASERVLVKSGMEMDRYIEKGFKKKGVWVEENLLSIDKEKWNKVNLSAKKR
jgi:ribosomal-protein-alanine N-acetyltransferase